MIARVLNINDENTKFMYSEKVYDVVERDFYKFNNPEFMKPEEVGIQYELKTFLKTRTKDCVRDAIARSLGISQYKCRILLKIRSTRFTLSKELQVVEDKVPVELIKERMGNDVDIYTIEELIRIEKGYVSLDALKEKGIRQRHTKRWMQFHKEMKLKQNVNHNLMFFSGS